MNKYEHTRILAERAKQLENGAEPRVDITGLDDALRIAQKELREGVIPLSIKKREITNGFFEFENELSGEDDGNQSESGNEFEDEEIDDEVSSDECELGGEISEDE